MRKRLVRQYRLSGKLINVYDSVTEASKSTGVSKTSISRVCRGERKNSGGYS
ncbi:NUMOD1 domain-containing DNA-binding protein [Formosa sp. S-31]|uniref:NUMOD1 domain-containing DNA-binding protein n=1 Tax=Formosa sp. S-31 TaxID=2790949 RepID=UPI003EC1167D